MRRLLFVLPLIVFLTLAGYLFVRLGDDPSIVPSALIDRPTPQVEVPALKTDKPGLVPADFEGRVTLVNVWASWCIPCRAEHPLVTRLARDEGIPVYGLNWKDERGAAIAWLDELGDPYERIGHDLSGRAGIEWGVYGVPETYVIDRDGRIRYKRVGPLMPELVETEILPLVRELSQ